MTLDAWKILKVASHVNYNEGRLTASGLVDLARGLGGGEYAVLERNKRGRTFNSGKAKVDLAGLVGEKVAMNRDVSFLLHLLRNLVTISYGRCRSELINRTQKPSYWTSCYPAIYANVRPLSGPLPLSYCSVHGHTADEKTTSQTHTL